MRWTYARTGLLALAVTLTVTGCAGGDDENAFETDVPADAVETTLDLLAGVSGRRPSAVLGFYVTAFLMRESRVAYRTAILGIDAQVKLRLPSDYVRNETYALLQDLGAALQVDVADLLNRAPDRDETLDEYLSALEELTNRGIEKAGALEEEFDVKQDELRDVRREAGKVRSALNRALREKDYASAGEYQQELSARQAELNALETENDEISDTIDLFEDLIEVAQERWTAITENREVILAGLEVVEVPGVEDIGVIRKETREQRREREDRTESVFGETE